MDHDAPEQVHVGVGGPPEVRAEALDAAAAGVFATHPTLADAS